MKKEVIKVVAATAIGMGVFGVMFVGVNNFALAAETEGVRPIQRIESQASTSAVQRVPQERHTPNTTNMAPTIRFESGSRTSVMPSAEPSANAISADAAAEIGTQYILDVLGVDIDGKAIHMMYSAHPSMTRTFWRAIVTEQQDTYLNNTLYEFTLDAVSGQRINISNRNRVMPYMPEEVLNALNEFFQDRNRFDEQRALRTGQPPAQLDGYIQTAKEFAERHFSATEVVSVEFVNSNALAFGFDEHRNLVAIGHQLVFTATDSTGRVADLAINQETHELIWLFTESNDIVPGFNYVGVHPGRG